MFSCVAGFVDAGESLEQCVRREVAEEVGVEVQEVGMYFRLNETKLPSLAALNLNCHV